MIHSLSTHWHTFLFVLLRLLRNPAANLLTTAVIGITLSLPAGMYTLLQNVDAIAPNVQTNPQISLFLTVTATKSDAQQVQTIIEKNPAIKSVRFVPRDQALNELKQNPGLSQIANSLDRNPLPDAFIIEPGNITPPALDQLRDELSALPNVAHIQLDSAWAKRLHALIQLGHQAVTILAFLLGFALIAITGNTIRLQILTQREEIEVSKLIGATNAFIRRPFLYHGALQGLAGGIAAWMIVTLSVILLNTNISELAQLYSSDFQLQPLTPLDSLIMLGLSASLGLLGAFGAVWQSIKRIEPR